jgi:hypothetical protein
MPHLDKLPTWFVKGDDRRGAYYSIQARELKADGWVEEGLKAKVHKPLNQLPEIVVEAGSDPYDSTESLTEPLAEEEALEDMTKAELLDWAMDQGHDLKNALPKMEIFAQCKEIEANL